MNVAGLIASFSTGTYTVTRTARGSTVRGKTEAGTTSTFTVTASVSPAKPMDLMRLPEGRRTTDTLRVITATELYNGGQGSDYEADTVSIDGESWEVNLADRWKDPQSGAVGYSCLLSVIR